MKHRITKGKKTLVVSSYNHGFKGVMVNITAQQTGQAVTLTLEEATALADDLDDIIAMLEKAA